MRDHIRKTVASIVPINDVEQAAISEVVAWIDSGVGLCRTQKPATPAKHLVSYFVVVDQEYVLLVDHINAEKWLPTGGHVECGEHPKETVIREAHEELGIQAHFIMDNPIMVTCTETVGKTAGHIDVSLWYVLKGDRYANMDIDGNEFRGVRWFHKDQLPDDTDPYLPSFVDKYYAKYHRPE